MSHISDKKKVINNPRRQGTVLENQERNKISIVMVLCNLKAAIHNITASNSTVDNERVSLGVGLYVPSEYQ
jgi:hypothetical protein